MIIYEEALKNFNGIASKTSSFSSFLASLKKLQRRIGCNFIPCTCSCAEHRNEKTGYEQLSHQRNEWFGLRTETNRFDCCIFVFDNIFDFYHEICRDALATSVTALPIKNALDFAFLKNGVKNIPRCYFLHRNLSRGT
jgi:hypothetical protein